MSKLGEIPDDDPDAVEAVAKLVKVWSYTR